MSTSAIAGVSLTPAALADEKGNAVVVRHAADAKWVERLMRAVCTEMGCTAGLATSPMDGATAKRVRMQQDCNVLLLNMQCLTMQSPTMHHAKVH